MERGPNRLARYINDQLQRWRVGRDRLIVSVAGESGSGKTTLAEALCAVRVAAGEPSALLHLDDYFRLPPAENHARRVSDLAWVGLGEVDLVGLERAAAHAAETASFVLVEGTYATRLAGVDVHIFIDRSYLETRADRLQRARDPIDQYTPHILAIEHELIRVQKAMAHLVVTPDWALDVCASPAWLAA